MKNILIRSFIREFPLVHIQLWGRRYVKTFLGESLPQIAMYVFIFKDGLVSAYRNEQLPEIINGIIKRKIEADSLFIDNLIQEKSKLLTALILVDNLTISKNDFIVYLNNLFDYWQIHYISQFIPLDTQIFSKENRDKAMKLRKTIDTKVTNFWNYITPILKRLYPGLGDLVLYISWDEIIGNNIPDIKELNKRRIAGMILINDQIVSRGKFESLKNKGEFELDQYNTSALEVKEVHGQSAFPGNVKGRVRIIMKIEEMNDFIKGEVLVSYVTIPAFLPIIKKANALVTDEGGITCHAAIISRELKKPCIIGTKNATKIFKNGDFVCVNANKGIVRIL